MKERESICNPPCYNSLLPLLSWLQLLFPIIIISISSFGLTFVDDG